MEATQSYPNLLSEKQAAKRLGVARITLLRAREAGRIRFFRIGTRVLYCAEQLKEFLNACERKGHKLNQARETKSEGQATRKQNRISSARGLVGGREDERPQSKVGSRKKDQASLPFTERR
jgi:excisionase family DNA binding protein